ncbi:16S rRNA (cytidine(1402)-2'-O)-methyltransferase [Denitrobacterium detoxificans]|jgi:16S rRNA (cytidine1402-2'-O)-methyltransferase|uniref:16S rRNA (cytidine(1402)-2'-O)-methyltransferase n=1 Tax=Denitrobacterium detoxificans TaxID=79604 RepID=UPI0026F0D551|nr:16S rRNA (cytidine(1402)-2'-O)-methyltransferase [Denitrobacterium detoxificans]MBE6465561.1 16S rRNA (cytidine(1402)-2'-O)-methyltransferase [Denitrobacterium detoxificans]
MSGVLYICPTPLGNLGDMTQRSLDALRAASVVYAEDTRVTGKLLSLFDIHTSVQRCDEASIQARAGEVLERVLAGETVAYCSDAGMPGVSDPGQRLIAAAREAGAPVEVLPGGTAVATAYVASGFTCPRFYFGGFFPRKEGERERVLQGLAALDAVLLFYESPRRAGEALQAIAHAFPHRRVALCRELTKAHEEVFVDIAPQVAQEILRRTEAGEMRGECVIVIDAPNDEERADVHANAAQDAASRAAELLAEGTHTRKDITKALQSEYGLKRNEAYAIVLEAGA